MAHAIFELNGEQGAIEHELALDFICERLSEPARYAKEQKIRQAVRKVLTTLRLAYLIEGPMGLSLGPKIVNYAGPGSERIMVLSITGKNPKFDWMREDPPGAALNVILFEVDEAKEEFTGRFWIDGHLKIEEVDQFNWKHVPKMGQFTEK